MDSIFPSVNQFRKKNLAETLLFYAFKFLNKEKGSECKNP